MAGVKSVLLYPIDCGLYGSAPVENQPTETSSPFPANMKAVADENMTDIEATFGRHLDVSHRPGRSLTRADLADAEVLLVRSVTHVDAGLLDGTPVRFVGSATIGTDHLDTDWLDRQGIRWASAPGCNADAAAQYTLGMIMLACRQLGRDLGSLRVAVVGRGNVGGRLETLLRRFGVTTVACDPPLAERGEAGLVDLDEALAADIVSLHVPLTCEGHWPTAGMIDSAAIARMGAGALLVNTARGAVVDGPALKRAVADNRIAVALDVWPNEPDIDAMLLQHATVVTPHVAGYSIQGKRRGTRMIYDAFLDWAGLTAPPGSRAGTALVPSSVDVDAAAMEPVTDAVLGATRVVADDRALRDAAPVDAGRFDALRRTYPPRNEFDQVEVHVTGATGDATRSALARLGFRIAFVD